MLEKLNLNLIFFVSCHVELMGHVEIVSSNLEGAKYEIEEMAG